MAHKGLRYALIGLEAFTGAMAIYGGVRLLADAAGFGVQEEWLSGSPFSNYQIPAIALLTVVGGGNLVPAALLGLRREMGLPLSIAAGVTLMGFEVLETYSFGLRNFQQPLMLAVGLTVAALATWMWRADSRDAIRLDLLHTAQ